MATAKQKRAARKNVKKAATVAREKRTIAHLPKSVRTALGKQAASVARRKNADFCQSLSVSFCDEEDGKGVEDEHQCKIKFGFWS